MQKTVVQPPVRHVVLALVTVYLAWGCSFPAIRAVVHVMPPLLVMGARFALAGLLLVAWHAHRHETGPRWHDRLRATARTASGAGLGSAIVAGTGLVGVGMGLTSMAEQAVPAGVASLLAATASLWMVGLAWLLHGQRPGRTTVAGLVLGTLGVTTLVVGGSGAGGGIGSPMGIAMQLASALAWAAATLHGSRSQHRLPGLLHAGVQMAWGGFLLVVAGVIHGDLHALHPSAVTPGIALALLFLVCGASIGGYSAYAWLLERVPAQVAATHAYVNPIVAIGVGAVALGEQVTGATVVALALVLGAVALLVRGGAGVEVAALTADGEPSVAELGPNRSRQLRTHQVVGVLDQFGDLRIGQATRLKVHRDPVSLVHVVPGNDHARMRLAQRDTQARLALQVHGHAVGRGEREQLARDAPHVGVRPEWPVVGRAGEGSAQRIELIGVHAAPLPGAVDLTPEVASATSAA